MKIDITKPIQFDPPHPIFTDPRIVGTMRDGSIIVEYRYGRVQIKTGIDCYAPDGVSTVHTQSPYKIINTPEKRVAREYWVNVYNACAIAHNSKSSADEAASPGRKECIHVREVLPEEEMTIVGYIVGDYFVRRKLVESTTIPDGYVPVFAYQSDLNRSK